MDTAFAESSVDVLHRMLVDEGPDSLLQKLETAMFRLTHNKVAKNSIVVSNVTSVRNLRNSQAFIELQQDWSQRRARLLENLIIEVWNLDDTSVGSSDFKRMIKNFKANNYEKIRMDFNLWYGWAVSQYPSICQTICELLCIKPSELSARA